MKSHRRQRLEFASVIRQVGQRVERLPGELDAFEADVTRFELNHEQANFNDPEQADIGRIYDPV